MCAGFCDRDGLVIISDLRRARSQFPIRRGRANRALLEQEHVYCSRFGTSTYWLATKLAKGKEPYSLKTVCTFFL